jgi:CRP/FNR family transcriptional regulator
MEKKHVHNNGNHVHTHGHDGESYDACITMVPIFNHLENEQMDEISKTTKSVSYKKNEIIYSAGEQNNSLYIVSKGKIRIYRLSESGKEQLVRILYPGDFTGELALFRESIHQSYAEAMVDTNVCMVTRSDLQEFLVKYQSIALKILFSARRRSNSVIWSSDLRLPRLSFNASTPPDSYFTV